VILHDQIGHRSRTSAVYNAPNHLMSRFSRVRWSLCILIALSQAMFASDWRDPESQLAGKIAAVTGPGVVALEINNRSSIPPAEVESIRRGLTALLGDSGIRVWDPDQAAATVKLTLSENLEDYVWTAEIRQGTGEANVAMISMPRPQSVPGTQNGPPLTLEVTPLISASEPLLDAAVIEGNPRRILVLQANAVTIYDFKDSHWIQDQSLPIIHPHPFPRDPRGRIVLRVDHLFDVYLPGVFCQSATSSQPAVNCSSRDDPWPLQVEAPPVSGFFSPTRNFFTGALAPGIGKQKAAPAFYSAAPVPRDKYVLWVFAGVDRQLHLLDGINEMTAGKVRWGSDLAAIHANCRPGWQVLASGAGDPDSDSLQAFEFPDREPLAVTQKITIEGTITALWPEPDGRGAIAVYRHFETGTYEAVQINLACAR
jgi:hypothetical protein